MVSLAAGAVVLVPFPFSDLSKAKLRPAIVLANAGRGDWILCQVTSKPYGDSRAIPILETSFVRGTLRIDSFARPGKLFTANADLIMREVGSLNEIALESVIDGVIRMLRRDDGPAGA